MSSRRYALGAFTALSIATPAVSAQEKPTIYLAEYGDLKNVRLPVTTGSVSVIQPIDKVRKPIEMNLPAELVTLPLATEVTISCGNGSPFYSVSKPTPSIKGLGWSVEADGCEATGDKSSIFVAPDHFEIVSADFVSPGPRKVEQALRIKIIMRPAPGA